MYNIFTDNTWRGRLLRTIIEAAIGFIIANVANILGSFALTPEQVSGIAAIITGVLSPVLAQFKAADSAEGGAE